MVCILLYQVVSQFITQDGGYVEIAIGLYQSVSQFIIWDGRERLLIVIDIRRAADFPL